MASLIALPKKISQIIKVFREKIKTIMGKIDTSIKLKKAWAKK